MKVYRNVTQFSPERKTVVTVGTFDGVHIGHQKILKRVNEIARDEGADSVLLTFFPHPRLVLFPEDNELRLLSTLEERTERLEKSGIDHLIIHPFTVEFSRITAIKYVRDILVNELNVSKLVIGYDHHFGRNREGNLEQLSEMSNSFGFEVEEIPAQEIDDVNVSSTKIRNALVEGNISKANEYLGYIYSVSGKVVEGNKLGRTLGYPTANIQIDQPYKLVPGTGVYLVYAELEGRRHQGMANIGKRPTVGTSKKPILEVNIFDLDRDLYGENLKVYFLERLRDELKFESLDKLQEQLHKDAGYAKIAFDNFPSALIDR